LTRCIVPEDREPYWEAVARSAAELSPGIHEGRIRTPGGVLKWVRGQSTPHRLDDGSICWDGILVDVTTLKLTEAALAAAEQRWTFALEGAGDGVWDWNLQSGHAVYSARWKAMFGDAESDIGDQAGEWSSRVHPDDMPAVMEALQDHLAGRTAAIAVEFRMQVKGGGWCWTQGRGTLVSRDDQGQPLRLVGTRTDITLRKELEVKLHQLAFYDALTGLPNRRPLPDRLSQVLAGCRRSGHFGALKFLDLDNFKTLNDRAGHAAGDALLVEVARRLEGCVRDADTVARLGGDEFVVMVTDLPDEHRAPAQQARTMADKLALAVARPYCLPASHAPDPAAGVEHRCTASIGVALLDPLACTVDGALSIADRAMYRAKREGANTIRLAAA
jgi:diguanylate cyclase (GGDEF)-like protein/PAS domain S-box-containing protein